MNGFLNILKPPGMTSHDVVAYIRKLFPRIKIGHGGTLDPGAAGVLPILLGRTTRLASFLQEFPKIYRAELYLGISTDTGDSFGNITSRSLPPSLGREEIEGFFSAFIGEVEQVPPMFSAVKSRGKKLYEYARRGQEVERPSRMVIIYTLSIICFFPPEKILFTVKCSSGTYVRSLCEQLGDAIGCGGHMSFLLRTDNGAFHLGASHTLEELAELARAGKAGDVLLPPDYPFRDGRQIVLDNEEFKLLRSGRQLSLTRFSKREGNFPEPVDGKLLAVYTTKGDFAALARWMATEKDSFVLKPEKIWQQ
ncbi:MAG: tRNA pseudouridine(55) synthase TruB [Bacillota bacterium]